MNDFTGSSLFLPLAYIFCIKNHLKKYQIFLTLIYKLLKATVDAVL